MRLGDDLLTDLQDALDNWDETPAEYVLDDAGATWKEARENIPWDDEGDATLEAQAGAKWALRLVLQELRQLFNSHEMHEAFTQKG